MNDDTTEQFACTLDARGAEERLPQVRALTDRLRGRERRDGRLVLAFADEEGTVDLVEELVRDESRCCGFFGFDIRRDDDEIVLELSAPPQAGHMLDAAMRAFDPHLDDEQLIDDYHRHGTRALADRGSVRKSRRPDRRFRRRPGPEVDVSLRLVDLLGGLSRLADLGFGLHAGESLRSAAVAVRLSQRLELPDEEVRAALYTALLHHVGCTGYAHETAEVYGDELAMNVAAARTDLGRVPQDVFKTFVPTLTQGRPPLERARLTFTALVRGRRVGEEYTRAACEVGRHAARRLGLSPHIQRSIYHVYELWQGGGVPDGSQADEIPVAARVARLTGIAVLFDAIGGVPASEHAVRQRAGGMLDPEIADAFLADADALLAEAATGDPSLIVLEAEPRPVARVGEPDLAEVAAVFGDLADLKTPYTHGHSRGVARLARRAGERLGLSPPGLNDLEVAALLHDVGRVAISSRVWEKRGALAQPEWEQVRLHAYHSERILAGSRRLEGLAQTAGMHHERLDGGGYHRAVDASAIPAAARVIAAADVYHAMTEPRPHRAAHSPDQATEQLVAEAEGGGLDPEAVEAVLAAAGREVAVDAPEPPKGLTERECEVLRLVADGATNAQIADRLSISRRTAEHHVQNIYGKLGTSSRAAAAVFAMEHGLLDRTRRDTDR